MAVKQSMKSQPLPKTSTRGRSKAKPVETPVTPAPEVAKGRGAKSRTTAAKSVPTPPAPKAEKPARVPRKSKTAVPAVSDTPIVTSHVPAATELLSQMAIQQQAIQTQAWLTNEITQLRQQLEAAQKAPKSVDQSALLSEIDQLQKENKALKAKAERLDQMTSLLQGQPPAIVSVSPTESAPPQTKTKTRAAVSKKTPVAKTPSTKAPAAKVPAASSRKPRGGVSILQQAAIDDVNRTFKSCWPIVFKIEEWNQKHPSQLAKVSQTMLNKSGVNFSRAKGFMDNYGDLIETYHQQIGLTKANSGKFNEVYEFIRASLGKGKKV